MATRAGRHTVEQDRPARHPEPGPSTLPPRPPVPYINNSNTWRQPLGNDRRYPDYSAQPVHEPSRAYNPLPTREHVYASRASYENPAARGGSSWQPTESYRPSQQFAPRDYSTRSPAPPYSPAPAPTKPYVPLHLRAPLVGAPAPTPYPLPPFPPTHFSGGSTPPAPVFEIPLPDDEYMELSAPFIAHEDDDAPSLASKLLVLDLNGTLIYRNKGGSNFRNAYPRPYLGSFFRYLYRPLADENQARPWEVFVWSSAQPHNVRVMLESTFDPAHIEGLWEAQEGEVEVDLGTSGKVLGVWARDKMGLSAAEYGESCLLQPDRNADLKPIKPKRPKISEKSKRISNLAQASNDSHSRPCFFLTTLP
jgi:hypothetical protein